MTWTGLFSLCACVVTAFALSAAMNKHKKFVMEHIQNATLAGGVAIGAVADLMVGPWVALTIGSIAGIISVLGYDILSVRIQFNFVQNYLVHTCLKLIKLITFIIGL